MLFIFAALFIATISAQNSTGGCDFTDVLPNEAFQALVNKIKSQSFSSYKLKVITAFSKSNNTFGLTSAQTITLYNLFNFSDDRVKCLDLVNKFILTISVDGLVGVLKAGSFSAEQVKTLRILVNLTSQADLKANSSKIIDAFTFSSDKATARQIIAKSAPRSCLFGPTDLPRFAFIIDVSGSMSERFQDADGSIYTRLGYVQKDLLTVMNSTLKSTQEFNIISFSDRSAAWQRGVVPVNGANIQSASNWVTALRAGGGTYMLNALSFAFSDPKVLGVYFLSDGAPSDNASAILSYAARIGKPINTVAFKAGTAAPFMDQIAKASGGTFRAIR